MTEPPNTSVDSFSDDALVARLYELASQLARGSHLVDRDELARIDSVVYRRLEQAYSKDPHDAEHRPGTRLDS
ncbi:MAG TPA: hypothetical protein VK827_12595 [Lysobacter sp.]|nr:hypothetical protein [Lysobacter sp.]